MLTFDPSYITASWNGRIKLAQFICSLLCGCILPNVVGNFFTRYAFFTFVIWTTFIYITIDLALNLSSACRYIPATMRAPDVMIYPVLIAALLFLLCSSLIAGIADISGRHAASGVAATIGFVLMGLFIAEAAIHFLAIRNARSPQQGGPVSANGNRIIIGMPSTRTESHLLPDPPPYSADSPTMSSKHGGDSRLGDFV